MRTAPQHPATVADEGSGAPAAGAAASRRRLLGGAALVLALAGLAAVFYLAARAAYGGNSDDATLVLQGQSMAAGHVTLTGWDLSYDAFWTSDVPFYALAVALLGVREQLMYLVPAVIAALLAVTAVWLALPRRGASGHAALLGAGVAVALLAFPSPVLAYFLLQAGWHAVTVLLCLVVFAGVARSTSRLGVAVAVVALAAALLGDLLAAVVAVGPLVIAGLVAVRRCASWRAGGRYLVVAAGGCAFALALRLAALAVGTYAIGSRSVLATSAQVLRNIVSLPNRVGGLFGVTDIVPGVASSPWPIRLVHLLVLAVVLAAFGDWFVRLLRAVVGGRAGVGSVEPAGSLDWRLEDLLGIAVVADLAAYCLFATDGAAALARYLIPGVVFAIVLAARRAGSAAQRLSRAQLPRRRRRGAHRDRLLRARLRAGHDRPVSAARSAPARRLPRRPSPESRPR